MFAGVYERERLHEPADDPDVRVRHAVLANAPIVRIEVVVVRVVVRVVVVSIRVVVVVNTAVVVRRGKSVIFSSKAEKASREQTNARAVWRVWRRVPPAPIPAALSEAITERGLAG